ncbi:MAG: hypothetical protein CBB67_004095 [Alteromonadaceae bacterium TMED7]|nr:MAG: hypothetical protein CBB67_004095 [Alteromonadaceae bacterium TMED7]
MVPVYTADAGLAVGSLSLFTGEDSLLSAQAISPHAMAMVKSNVRIVSIDYSLVKLAPEFTSMQAIA